MFIICGSGRSGTSAVAKLLHDGGVSVGRDLIEADDMNPEGYYEERAVVTVNEQILNECGLREWFSVASREEIIAAAGSRTDTMRDLVDSATPAWKDPRFSWTLEAWLPLLSEPPRIIVCLRSPAEVAASVMRYYGLAGDEARDAVLHTWRIQYERLLDVIDEYRLDATTIEYGALHARRRATATALSGFVGATLDPAAIRRDLRHHRASVPNKVLELYERVRSLAPDRPVKRAAAARSVSGLSRA